MHRHITNILGIAFCAFVATAPAAAVEPDPAPFECQDSQAYFDVAAVNAGSVQPFMPSGPCTGLNEPGGWVFKAVASKLSTTAIYGAIVTHAAVDSSNARYLIDFKIEKALPPGADGYFRRGILQFGVLIERKAESGAIDSTSVVATSHFLDARDGPTCVDQTVHGVRDTPIELISRCNGVGVTLTLERQPAHGAVTGPDATGNMTYVPAAGFTGSDSFVVRATNVVGSATSTVSALTRTPTPVPTLPLWTLALLIMAILAAEMRRRRIFLN